MVYLCKKNGVMTISMKDWVSSVITDEKVGAIPILTHLGVELLGSTLGEAVTNANNHANAVHYLAELYPFQASTMMMDLTVEAEAFGAKVLFSEKRMPDIVGRLLNDAKSIEELKIPSLDAGRIPTYLKANEMVASRTKHPVLSGCIGPFSLAGRLYGMTEIMMGLFLDSDSIHLLLRKCAAFITSYCKALHDAGSNGVLMAEPAAGLLSAAQCSEFSSAYVREIVQSVQTDDFIVILHNCGNRGQCTRSMVETKAAGYHFGNKTNMKEALEICPQDVLVMGNVDPTSVLKLGTPDSVYAETISLLEQCGIHNNFVLSSGCDIPPETSKSNIDAFFEALKEYNKNSVKKS